MGFNLSNEVKKAAFEERKTMPLGWWVGQITNVVINEDMTPSFAEVSFRWFLDSETFAPEHLQPFTTRFWGWNDDVSTPQERYNVARYVTFVNAVGASIGKDITEIEDTKGAIVLARIAQKKNGFLTVADFDAVPSNRRPFNLEI